MKKSRLFGTDGIRGVAGAYPLDERTVFLIGRALGRYLRRKHAGPRVLIGEDTRESSRWIAETLAAGLAAEGAEAVSAGVLPTPGIAYLSRTNGFAAGVMISASHNQYRDNGIKVFAHSGYKLPDDDELEVEDDLFRLAEGDAGAPSRLPLRLDDGLCERYVEFLCARLPPGLDLGGMPLVLDCANGAACRVAPEVFRRIGARVTALHTEPDGRNVNLNCGSLHMEKLQARVPAEGAALGVAFDGDADRALFVTAGGREVNGDGVLFLAARRMQQTGQLARDLVVGTVMSNLGLETALHRYGLRLARTLVGDKYVLEEMRRSGANVGGEQSGHVIFGDDHTTGDGLLTALKVVAAVAATGRSLEEQVAEMAVFPQILLNVPVREKVPLEQLPAVTAAIRASESHFGASGRVLVRYSGTESLVRIMVEAHDEQQVLDQAYSIAAAFQRAVGA